MENIKLPDSFVKYSEEEYSYDSAEQASFRDGAKAMLTAVEKLLDGELSKQGLAHLISDDAGRAIIKIVVLRIENLKEQLKSIQP